MKSWQEELKERIRQARESEKNSREYVRKPTEPIYFVDEVNSRIDPDVLQEAFKVLAQSSVVDIALVFNNNPGICKSVVFSKVAEEQGLEQVRMTAGTCGAICEVSSAGFKWSSAQVLALTPEQRRGIAEHERGHLAFSKYSEELKKEILFGLQRFEEGCLPGKHEELPCCELSARGAGCGCDFLGFPTAPEPPKEAPCTNCSRPNDLGAKSCWWCETSNPTRS